MMCPSLLKLPDASASGLPARALLGFMDREEASAFLLEDCIFNAPLSLSLAEEIWQAQKAVVDELPAVESASPRRIPLSAADLKSARKFRTKHPAETSIVDFVNLNPMDLVVHQHWISTAIAERYRDVVAPDKWHRTSLLDPPADSGVKWRREEGTIVFDLPKFEYLLMGPFAPDGTMRPGSALDFVSVAFHKERALLINGYHRTFAAAQYGLQTANAPRGLLFGVSNFLDLMGSGADQMRSVLEGKRPPRMADFFDDRLAVAIALRKRRYQMRVHFEVVALDEDQSKGSDSGISTLARPVAPIESLPNVDAILEEGMRHFRAGRLDAAVELYQRALFLKPDSAEINSALGITYANQKKMPEAAEHCARALVLKPDSADAHYNLGCVRTLQGDFDRAIVHQRRVIAINPRHPDAHQQLGYALTCKGRFVEAIEHCERAIAIKPDHVEAHFTRAAITRFCPGDPGLAHMEKLAATNSLPAEKLVLIHFALAKALEESADFERAFEQLIKGNTLKRSQIDYDERVILEKFDRLAQVFDAAVFDKYGGFGDNSSVPIFIVGMPRSGSSLIEQILASHPEVDAGGEMDYMLTEAKPILKELRRSSESRDVSISQIGEMIRNGTKSYLGQLRRLSLHAPRIVDKMPANFLNIGLIRLMLPNARIIHTVRNPLDTCVSCYSKLFREGNGYAYQLDELGRYYRQYAGLMDHWKSLFPASSLLDVVYEDVVDDFEGQARRLVEYCGLQWDDRCLEFHRTERVVNTLSSFQVRQPLFRSSVGRWRRYEFGLGPLLAELGDMVPRHAAIALGN